jgi:hypothetical protein
MTRTSKVDRLPAEIRELIAELRSAHGWTVAEIEQALRSLAAGGRPALPAGLPPELAAPPPINTAQLPHYSKLAAHVQGLDKLAERLQRSRAVAEAMVRKLDNAPEGRAARLNVELLHSAVTDLFLKVEAAGEDGAPVSFDPRTVHDLAKALDHLTRAQDRDQTATLKLRELVAAQTKAAAGKAAEAVAKEKGLSADLITAIKASILGVQTPKAA